MRIKYVIALLVIKIEINNESMKMAKNIYF